MIDVLAPFTGSVLPLSAVPDPVFAAQLVGAGVAVMPDEDADSVTAHAPVAGRIVKLHAHAFAIEGSAGTDVLVHVGIGTVGMHGRGFTLIAHEGDEVEAGDPIVLFEPATVVDAGCSPVCAVVVLRSAPDSVPQDAVGSRAATGSVLYRA